MQTHDVLDDYVPCRVSCTVIPLAQNGRNFKLERTIRIQKRSFKLNLFTLQEVSYHCSLPHLAAYNRIHSLIQG